MIEVNSHDHAVVFITGATGYIGQRLAHTLAGQGIRVHALVRNPKAAGLLNHPQIRCFEGDLQDIESVRKAMKGCEQVYHVGGLARLVHKDSSLFYKINVDGTRNLLLAATDAGIRKFVYTSTTGVIGPSLREPMCESDPRIIGYDNDYEAS